MNTSASRSNRVTELSTLLSRAIRGQPDALVAIADLVACREHEMTPPKGCRGALLFVGPTGVGKTESAKALAEALFGDGCMAQFDASEFSQPQSLEVALGDGRELRGRLQTAYDLVPEGVWLFDEIEKGCEPFKDLLIQITYEGKVTLASGRTLDFSKVYVIATSNLGSREILEREHLPFTSLEKHVVERLEHWFRAELLARFDSPIVFRALDWDTQKEIARKRLDELVAWHREHHQRSVSYAEEVVEFVLATGYSPRYGARPLLRTIDRLVSLAVLNALREGRDGQGSLVIEGERLRVDAQ
jgi:ATP-dependent Clp protease ATP-binding subunit ClpC